MGSRESRVARIVRRTFLTACLFLLMTSGLFGVLSCIVESGDFMISIPRAGWGGPGGTIAHTRLTIRGYKGHIVLEHWNWKNTSVLGIAGLIPDIDKSLFGSFHYRVFDDRDHRAVELSCRSWIPMVVFGLPVILGTIPRWRLAHRRRRGLCISCGYNLTGNTSGRCPECGTPPVNVPARHARPT